MQARGPPKIYQLLIRTQKLTIFVTAQPTDTVASVKEQVLSALSSDANRNADVEIPSVQTVNDFELSKATRGKDRSYEVLEPNTKIKDAIKLVGWEVVYIQFRDSSGELGPVDAVDPPIEDDEEMPPPPPPDAMESEVRRGKRKAED